MVFFGLLFVMFTAVFALVRIVLIVLSARVLLATAISPMVLAVFMLMAAFMVMTTARVRWLFFVLAGCVPVHC